MTIHWTPRAQRQFLAIIDRILADNPYAAERVYEAITDGTSQLMTFPERGRRGRISGTRELVIPSLPYIVAYRVRGGTVHVLAVMHSAQRWPEQF